MSERPLRPAFRGFMYSAHAQNHSIEVIFAVPNKVLPMDIYNALSAVGIGLETHYGWITTTGRHVSSEVAAELALEANLLDRKVKYLSIEDYRGAWQKNG